MKFGFGVRRDVSCWIGLAMGLLALMGCLWHAAVGVKFGIGWSSQMGCLWHASGWDGPALGWMELG